MVALAKPNILVITINKKQRERAEKEGILIVDASVEDALNEQYPLIDGLEWFAATCSREDENPELPPDGYYIAIFPAGRDDLPAVAAVTSSELSFVWQEKHLLSCSKDPHTFTINFPKERFLEYLKDE